MPVFPLRFRRRRSLLEHPIPAGGIGPSLRLGYRTALLSGPRRWLPRCARSRLDRGGCLLCPETVVPTRLTRALQPPPAAFPAASPLPPVVHSIAGVICDEAIHGGLPSFTRPVISLACSARMARAPVDVNPDASNPTVTGDARQSGNRPMDTGPELHCRHRVDLQSASSLVSCDLVSQALSDPYVSLVAAHGSSKVAGPLCWPPRLPENGVGSVW